jgi:transposase
MSESEPQPECPNCQRLERRVRELEAQVEHLTGLVDRLTKALEASQRAGKRQAAPFSKGKQAGPPKPPGRKSGDEHGVHRHRAVPGHIDEVHAAPLPKACPECGGRAFSAPVIARQYQTEIPRRPIVRQFDIEIACCQGCGVRVQGRHPLQTSDALGAAASQLGPDAHALQAVLNKSCGLSHGKIRTLFQQAFGITLARATSCRSVRKTAGQCRPAYEQIRQSVRGSPWVVPDETGWRVDGRSAWLHAFVGKSATCYAITPGRGHEPLTEVIGEDYSGDLIHDGWVVYDRFRQAGHQACLAHLLRRCHELLEVAERGAVRFPQAVKALLQRGLAVRDRCRRGELPLHGVRVCAGRLTEQLRKLVRPVKTHAGNERFAKFLERHVGEIFTFLRRPQRQADGTVQFLDATNWRAEQAIRPAVVNRKVWGGNRTWPGAEAQAILTSVLATAAQHALDLLPLLSRARTEAEPVLVLAGR